MSEKPSSYHEIPVPHNEAAGRSNNDRGSLSITKNAKFYRPADAPHTEPPVATMARFANRLLDPRTGKGFTAETLPGLVPIIHANGEGVPVNGIAGVPHGVPHYIRVSGEIYDGDADVDEFDIPFSSISGGYPSYVSDGGSYSNSGTGWTLTVNAGEWSNEDTSVAPADQELEADSPATGTPELTGIFPTEASAVGQLCIVGDPDANQLVFVCTRLNPVKWQVTGPFAENTAAPGSYVKITFDGTNLETASHLL
jgi:hypothetical protein